MLLYGAVNLLFVAKYSLRIGSGVALVAVLGYVAVCVLLYAVVGRWLVPKRRVSTGGLAAVFGGSVAVLASLQMSLDPYSIQVDRWSAIHFFLDRLLSGEYPYLARTHLGGYGSPFPVWQMLHLPFYCLGNVGLSVFVAWGFLTYAVRRFSGNATAMCSTLLMVFSPAFVYEVAVRSDLMTNFMLVAAIILLLETHGVRLSPHWKAIAVGCGLLLSTRLTAVVPMGVYYLMEWWRLDGRRRILFVLVVVMVFVLTFLPFLLWDMNDLLFFKYNPFVLQSRQSHVVDFMLFVPLAVYWAMTWTRCGAGLGRVGRLMGNTAYLLLTLVGVTFVHNMAVSGNYDLFSSAYDITYLGMSMPFLVAGLAVSSR